MNNRIAKGVRVFIDDIEVIPMRDGVMTSTRIRTGPAEPWVGGWTLTQEIDAQPFTAFDWDAWALAQAVGRLPRTQSSLQALLTGLDR